MLDAPRRHALPLSLSTASHGTAGLGASMLRGAETIKRTRADVGRDGGADSAASADGEMGREIHEPPPPPLHGQAIASVNTTLLLDLSHTQGHRHACPETLRWSVSHGDPPWCWPRPFKKGGVGSRPREKERLGRLPRISACARVSVPVADGQPLPSHGAFQATAFHPSQLLLGYLSPSLRLAPPSAWT